MAVDTQAQTEVTSTTRTTSAASGSTPPRGETFEVENPSTGEVFATVPKGGREDAHARDRGRARVVRLRRVGGHGPRRARADHAVGGRQVHRARGRARRARVAAVGHDDPRDRHRGDRLLHRATGTTSPARPTRPRQEALEPVSLPDPLLQLRAARADRRVRRHHPVELPAGDGGVEARAGAGDGQQRGAQAGVEHAAHRAAAGRAARRDRPAQGRGQRDHRRRRDGGRGAGLAPRRRQGLVHRLDRGRPADHAARLEHDQEVHAGAGRQVAEHRLRGRRTSRPAVDGALWATFFHQGQVCESGTRLLLPESIHDEFVERLVERAKQIKIGDALDYDSDMGPLVSAEQLETGRELRAHRPGGGREARARRQAPRRTRPRAATTSSRRSSPTSTTR